MISGPYSGHTPEQVDAHIELARRVAVQLTEAGHQVLTPHLNSAQFERLCNAPYESYLSLWYTVLMAKYDDEWLVEAVVLLPGWYRSPGARYEADTAKTTSRRVYGWPDDKEELGVRA